MKHQFNHKKFSYGNPNSPELQLTPEEIAEFEAAEARKRPNSRPRAFRTSRNDPCPCGSGLKYKKCCLKG